MKKFYLSVIVFMAFVVFTLLPKFTFSQVCDSLAATYILTESRCAATGTIQIFATGGSGNYQYKASGPVNINYTSSAVLTGLSAGKYLVTVLDLTSNCVYNKDSVTITGNYLTPNFTMVPTGVTCINGNDGKITVTGQTNGRAPIFYKIIAPSASAVGTISASGSFTGLLSGNYLVQLRDSCGGIQTRSITVDNYDWIINSNVVSKVGCDSINVTLTLKDSKNNLTPHPIFNGFTYGASKATGDTTWYTTNTFRYYNGPAHVVKLFVKDFCGNIKSVNWTEPVPSVNNAVAISNVACSTFSIRIRSQTNLTSPIFCIFDKNDVQLSCNGIGIFDNVPFGSYCVKMTDACYDTVITRCFTVSKPIPSVSATVSITRNCNSITATITGQTNLNNAVYCLYDNGNTQIACNGTGTFSNLPYGNYCIEIKNDAACYDTTITRCFTALRIQPSVNQTVAISNLACSTFTATIRDTANWNSPQFCLYTPARVLIVCNTTGIFNNLSYGTYCLDIVNGPGCYDTTITLCFNVKPPKPSVAASVTISNKNCTGFTAAITGQTNINNAEYCLYNNLNILLSCNSTGTFNNIPYGNYCIKTTNDMACYDTTIDRCFSAAIPPIDITLSASKSCSKIGASNLRVNFVTGNPAYTVSLYAPTGSLMQTIVSAAANHTFTGIADLIPPLKYKIVVTDLCGNKDSDYVAPVISLANRVFSFSDKCPSSLMPLGSKDVVVDLTSNNFGGTITSTIIKKNNVVVSISPNTTLGYRFTFLELGPGTYIFDSYIDNCSRHIYDTISVTPYIFPDLYGSKAFQCENSSFSVNGNTINGKAPFNYEIFGSVPALPSIITAPQPSPVFAINNGTSYSLIRLRVVDGCGNASLYDASVLPLANFIVSANKRECFNQDITLRVDSIGNADYKWYKRIIPNDSLLVSTSPSFYIPNLTTADTGRYFCRVVINNGCLVKYANFILTGFCQWILPIEVSLSGKKQTDGNRLTWNSASVNIKEYVVQRRNNNTNDFETVNITANSGKPSYSFIDKMPLSGNNFYRLKITDKDNKVKYSNVVLIKNSQVEISFYPNPVNNMLYISISDNVVKDYTIEISNFVGQKIMSKKFKSIQNAVINYPRNAAMVPGVYTISIIEIKNNERQTFKVIYQ
jgi:hypothetical protein